MNIQARIAETGIKYVDEDWGQLDLFMGDFPVQFPCCLFNLETADFENIGQDRKATPAQRQTGRFNVELCIADMKLSGTSANTPISQKEGAWKIHNIIEDVHKKIQGFNPAENCSKLIRRSSKRIRRDDGIQEYRIIYDFQAENI